MLAGNDLSLTGIAAVTAVSCLFGMLSSASRLTDAQGASRRALMMNGGAVWIAAFSIAMFSGAGLAPTALIGLGVGLAGTKVLEVVEAGVIAITKRTVGEQPVTRDEMLQMIGDSRNRTQAALAERVLEERGIKKRVERTRKSLARETQRSTGQDGRMDGMVEENAIDHDAFAEHIRKIEDRSHNSDGSDE